MKSAFFSLCVGLLTAGAITGQAHAHAGIAIPQEGQTVSFILENDFFIGDDSNYTNGVDFAWMSSSTADSESFAGMLGTVIGGTGSSNEWGHLMGMGNSRNLRQQWGMNLSQLMFTPEDKSTEPLYGQHPYVGHLSLTLSSLVKNETRGNLLQLQLGVTGSPSMAKGSQHFVHKLWGMEQWPGWGNQLPSEMTVNLNFRRYYRVNMGEWEDCSNGVFYWHADLGTVRTQVGAGFTWVLGGGPDLYPMAGIGHTIASPFAVNTPQNYTPTVPYFAYANASVRVVAHDLYLDGTVFHDCPKYVNSYPVIGEWGFGVGAKFSDFIITAGLHYTTKEHTRQDFGQCVGVIQVKYSF